jgi:hypothetical protein
MSNQPTFMDFVQDHERTWGKEGYTGRPDLVEVLNSPVVVFWQSNSKDERPTITLYRNLDELESYFQRILFASNAKPPDRRVLRIFKGQKPVLARGIKVIFSDTE